MECDEHNKEEENSDDQYEGGEESKGTVVQTTKVSPTSSASK